MNNKTMENPTKNGVIPCTENAEPGTFFSVTPGYVRMFDRFRVGSEINIQMQIKPRNTSGLLAAVYGKRDYLLLEMVDGAITFTVDNGRGPFSTTFMPRTKHYFCNGQWHSIQAVKSKSVVTLGVNKIFSSPVIGDEKDTSTDTGGGFFLGGHRLFPRLRGISTKSTYVGCIKNVEINNEPINITPAMVEGGATFGFCPKN